MAAPQLPSPPRAPPAGPGPRPPWLSPPLKLGPEPATCPRWAAVASCAAASVGEWSALEFEQGPEPSQRHLRKSTCVTYFEVTMLKYDKLCAVTAGCCETLK